MNKEQEVRPCMWAEVVADDVTGELLWECREADGRGHVSTEVVVELSAKTFAVGTMLEIREPGFFPEPPARRSSDEQAEVVAWMLPGSGSITTDLGTAAAWAKDFGCTVQPLYRAPPAVAAGGVTEGETDFGHELQPGAMYANYSHDGNPMTNDRLEWLSRWHPVAEVRVMAGDLWQRRATDVVRRALAVGDEGIREGAKDTVDYVMRYGGRCRDCADENGTCPHSGLPCDTDAASKVIGFVLRAVDYGQRHGYLPAKDATHAE